jgi:hypothetical protein
MGFAHQTYAEFLAARYLNLHRVPFSKVSSLLRHPNSLHASIVPQLYETATWISSQSRDIRETIAQNEPQILLRSDASVLTMSDRATIVDSLLQALHVRSIDLPDWNLSRHYNKLLHDGLAGQLQPWIIDRGKHVIARRAAMDIAVACELTGLQSILADLALNQNEHQHLREIAADGVATMGDAPTRERLRPFASGNGGDDPDDQLKGYALKALWPDLIKAEEVFANLTRPKRESFYGSYLNFIRHRLLEHLRIEDLPIAIRWVKAHYGEDGLGLRMTNFGDQVIILAWKSMDDPSVFESLSDLCIELLLHDHDLLEERREREEHVALFDDPGKRRKLAKNIIEKSLNPKIAFDLTIQWPRLIRADDFEWCVQQLLSSISQPAENIWARVVWDLSRREGLSTNWLEMISDARARSSELRDYSNLFFTPVLLGSKRAREMKKQYEIMHAQVHGRKPKVLDWLPKERVEHYLQRIEKGEHQAWWVLLREMTLEDTDTHYESQRLFETDVTELPGWQEASENTRKRILDSAEIYLYTMESYNRGPLYECRPDERDAGVYKTFRLLWKLRPGKIKKLPDEVWEHWLPILFGVFRVEDDTVGKRLLMLASDRIPMRFTGVIGEIILRQIDTREYLPILDTLQEIWNQHIRDVIWDKMEEAERKPVCWGKLLRALVVRNDSKAETLAKSRIMIPLPDGQLPREVALQAALVLIECTQDAAWQFIWPIFQKAPDFGREVMMELALSLHPKSPQVFSKMDEHRLAELFIWLEKEFPHSGDRHYEGAYTPNKEDLVREFRDNVIRFLENVGTSAGCEAIEQIIQAFPEYEWVKSTFVRAREKMLQKTWNPLIPEDLLRLIQGQENIMVRDANELQDILLNTLSRLEQLLQGETPAAPDLWDQVDRKRGHEKFRPKDENHLSDWVKRQLQAELNARAIIVAREVEIRRGLGSGIGEETDLHVTAVVPGIAKETFEQVRVIIETKGCWNRELEQAIQTQLVDRYLKDNQCRHGIFLVGWYKCDQWDSKDYRKKRTPNWTMHQAREIFDQKAKDLSNSDLRIRSFVINAALR